MTERKHDVLLIGPAKPYLVKGLDAAFRLHVLATAIDRDAMIDGLSPRLRLLASSAPAGKADRAFIARLPRLEIISSFGVGYDHVDVAAAAERGIIVCHTPDVLTEEVADTAVGLLLCALREFPQADRFIRAGKWSAGDYPLSRATLRNRTVGIVGLGRIGKAIARRLDAFATPVVYHSRNPQTDVSYRYYPRLIDMARDVDTLLVIAPGGAATRHMINAEVLAALGPNGVLINMGRGSIVDEAALIKALQQRTIYSAGLDVFANEPHVPPELIAMDHVVLLPHIGSASLHTREQMEQLVIDNLVAWAAGNPPLTPVPETPWRPGAAQS